MFLYLRYEVSGIVFEQLVVLFFFIDKRVVGFLKSLVESEVCLLLSGSFRQMSKFSINFVSNCLEFFLPSLELVFLEVLSHMLLEHKTPTGLEVIHLSNDFIWDVGKVQEDHDKI